MSATLYEELEVEREADLEAIKRAYRRRSKATHPDAAGGCGEKFQKVQHAYDVLSDPARRRHYDETGDDGSSRRKQRRLEEMLGRLSGTGAQLFCDVLSSKVAGEVKHQAELERAMRVGERMQDLLEEVMYRAGGGDPAVPGDSATMEDLFFGLMKEKERRGRKGVPHGGIFGS